MTIPIISINQSISQSINQYILCKYECYKITQVVANSDSLIKRNDLNKIKKSPKL